MTIRLEVGNCPLCGRLSYLYLEEELAVRILDWDREGRQGYIQDVFPELTIAQRETIISGCHDKCFDEAFEEE